MTQNSKKTRAHLEKGQTIAEFVIVLPVAAFLILAVTEMAFMGIRSIIAQHAAYRAARVAGVYQGEFSETEVNTKLPTILFYGGQVTDTNSEDIKVETLSKMLFSIRALDPALVIRRSSPRIFALPEGLNTTVLREGDTPSPYCRYDEGYESCDFPQ